MNVLETCFYIWGWESKIQECCQIGEGEMTVNNHISFLLGLISIYKNVPQSPDRKHWEYTRNLHISWKNGSLCQHRVPS
ncbi:hypothetical protein XELAEV_18010490mg [Xenopus laevis]|uniref:Uncharacterized protein n=1 Tax=Xenopus laevis TaxID=8355 RepID=A0A974DUM2_XENLA|nr:hypothetical protein XELAEV_18010490mg [Xenopus laevis]